MTWQEQLDKTAQHYAELARDPAWKAYARARVLEMESDPLGCWRGLTELVRKKLAEGGE